MSCPLGVNKTCNKTPQQVQLAGPTRVTRVAMDRANAIAPASPTCGAHCCGFLPGGSRSCHIARRRTCRAAQSSPTSAGALRTSGHGRSFAASSTAPRVLSFGTWCWGCGLKRNRTKDTCGPCGGQGEVERMAQWLQPAASLWLKSEVRGCGNGRGKMKLPLPKSCVHRWWLRVARKSKSIQSCVHRWWLRGSLIQGCGKLWTWARGTDGERVEGWVEGRGVGRAWRGCLIQGVKVTGCGNGQGEESRGSGDVSRVEGCCPPAWQVAPYGGNDKGFVNSWVPLEPADAAGASSSSAGRVSAGLSELRQGGGKRGTCRLARKEQERGRGWKGTVQAIELP